MNLIYAAPCHRLKKSDETADISLSNYFKWSQRHLFNFSAIFSGFSQNKAIYEYAQISETTTLQYVYERSIVINYGRENKRIVIKPDNSILTETDPDFDPGNQYGRPPVEKLLNIRYNPCLPAEFRAWCNAKINYQNLIYEYEDYGENENPNPDFDPSQPPKKPDDTWIEWSVSNSEIIFLTPSKRAWLHHINAKQRIVLSATLIFKSGYIDPQNYNVGDVIVTRGFAILNKDGQNAKISVANTTMKAKADLPEGIKADVKWSLGQERSL